MITGILTLKNGGTLNVFEFRQNLVDEYSDFTRSFTRIKADDIRAYVDAEYDSQKYWPEPLVQVNPNFKDGGTVQALTEAGTCTLSARKFSGSARVRRRPATRCRCTSIRKRPSAWPPRERATS